MYIVLDNPLSRTGLVTGMVLALLAGKVNYEYEPIRVDTIRQELELDIRKPEPTASAKIDHFTCAYGSDYCGTELGNRVVWWSNVYHVSPYIVAAIGVHESGLSYTAGSLCTFGYASCRVRFSTIDDEIRQVVKTLAGYGRGEIQSLSIWHTGGIYDRSGYPERVQRTAGHIAGL